MRQKPKELGDWGQEPEEGNKIVAVQDAQVLYCISRKVIRDVHSKGENGT